MVFEKQVNVSTPLEDRAMDSIFVGKRQDNEGKSASVYPRLAT